MGTTVACDHFFPKNFARKQQETCSLFFLVKALNSLVRCVFGNVYTVAPGICKVRYNRGKKVISD